jgi:ankyrin repeat protein
LLLAQGADVNAVQAGGFTPLFSVAAANRRDLAELLLAHGAHAQSQSERGKTAAEFARERGHTKLAALLESQSP